MNLHLCPENHHSASMMSCKNKRERDCLLRLSCSRLFINLSYRFDPVLRGLDDQGSSACKLIGPALACNGVDRNAGRGVYL